MASNMCEDGQQQESGYFTWDTGNITETLQGAAKFFNENGYAVLRHHASIQQMNELKECGEEIIREFFNENSENLDNMSVFSTKHNNQAQSKDDKFLKSANDITCFLEEQSKDHVNKIGHALHDIHPTFQKFVYGDNHLNEVVKHIGGIDSGVVVQSMYIVKSARVGGVVSPHRDCTFIIPESNDSYDCIGLWWAIEKANGHNGCLYIVPKSHTHHTINKKFIRKRRTDHDGDELAFEGTDDMDGEYVKVEADVGDLVLLHGNVIHKSETNVSGISRHAFSVHVVQQGLNDHCWLRRSNDFPFRKFIL